MTHADILRGESSDPNAPQESSNPNAHFTFIANLIKDKLHFYSDATKKDREALTQESIHHDPNGSDETASLFVTDNDGEKAIFPGEKREVKIGSKTYKINHWSAKRVEEYREEYGYNPGENPEDDVQKPVGIVALVAED